MTILISLSCLLLKCQERMPFLVCFDALYEWDTESMCLSPNPFQTSMLTILQGFATLLLIWFSTVSFLLKHPAISLTADPLPSWLGLGHSAPSGASISDSTYARERALQSRKQLHQRGLKQGILINCRRQWFGLFFGFFFGGGKLLAVFYLSRDQGLNAKVQPFVLIYPGLLVTWRQ